MGIKMGRSSRVRRRGGRRARVQPVGAAPPVGDASENDIQAHLFTYMETLTTEDGLSVREHAFAVPNGMQIAGGPKARGKYMNAMKARGLTPGVSDVVLAMPRGWHPGAFFELKREKNFVVSDEQLSFRKRMEDRGYYAVIVYGWEATKSCLDHYLNMGRPMWRFPL